MLGVYGGGKDPQVGKSGGIVIGAADGGITTVLDFGITNSKANGIYGTGSNLGNTTESGVNKTVLTSISLLGTLTGTGDINASGKSSTTKVTGRLFGGGKEGGSVYGSTSLSLSQVHFVGGTGELGDGAGVLVGGGFTGTTVFGDVTTKVKNSVIDSRIFGAGGSVKGDVSLTVKGSKVAGDIYGGTYGSGDVLSGVLNMVIEDSFVTGSIYGLRDGQMTGKVNLSLKNTSVTEKVTGGSSLENGTKVKGGVEMILDNVTTGYVGIAGNRNETVEGDSTITIKGNSVIRNINATGGAIVSSGYWLNTLEKGKVKGNLTLNIEGGTIGEGLLGFSFGVMSMVSTDGNLEGDATLNVTGGVIKNETLVMLGIGANSTGSVYFNLSGTGKIESNIYAASAEFPGSMTGNWTVGFDGGTLGLAGETRRLDGGTVKDDRGEIVKGNVDITLDGEKSGGVGTVFLGDYSIFAGASKGKVGGNTSVTLSNIDKSGGVADFGGIISGANDDGGGVTGSVRSLTFDKYTTGTQAQYKHFTQAIVKGGSAVTMGTPATVSNVDSWDIQDSSKLTLASAAQLGGATSMNIGEQAELVFNLFGSTAQDAGVTALTGSGLITKSGDAQLTLGSVVSGFNGTFRVNAGILSLTGIAIDFGEGTDIVLGGGVLMTEKTEDFVLNSKLSGTGTLEINNVSGKKTTLNNSESAFIGDIKVNGGILELGEGVSYSSNKVNIGAGGWVNLSGLMRDSLGVIEGSGTLHLNGNDGISTGDQLKNFHGILSIGRNAQFDLTVGGTQLINGSATIAFNERSELVLNNTSEAIASFTLGNMSLSGVENVVTFKGASTDLVISNGDGWMTVTAGADMGQLTFDMSESMNSTVKITNLTNRNQVFANIFLNEGGVTYQSFVNESGFLGKLTLDMMTELPKVGVPSENITSYKITGANTELADGVLRMSGYSTLSSLNIVADEKNLGWNLNGNDVLLRSGSLMYQGSTYRISGGRLLSDSGLLGIQIANSDWTMTISSEIGEKDGLSKTALKKMGGGKLIMDGKLSNKGGIQVVGGTLQLQGQSVGSAANGILSNSATLELGNGNADYVLGFTETVNNGGATLVVNGKATLGHKVTNSGTVTLKEGAKLASDITLINNKDVRLEIGSGKTMDLDATKISGTGSLFVDSGTAVLGSEIGQNFFVAHNAQLTWNMGSAANMGKVMTGNGLVQVNNTTGRGLDLSSVVLGTNWKDFTGTLNLNSARGEMRIKVSGEMGSSKLMVGKGSQYWDAVATAIRGMNMELTGIGYEGTGALRVSKSGTYTGAITLGNEGARISTDGIMVTLRGGITGGVLEIGSTDTTLTSFFTLSGDNTQALTRLMGKSHLVVDSLHGLGQGLELSNEETGAEFKGRVETGKVIGVEGAQLNLIEGSCLTVTGATNGTFAGFISGKGDLIKQGLGEWTLSGENSQSGQLKVDGGKLIVGNVLALGNQENKVSVGESGHLELSSFAVTQGITLTGGAGLSGAANYAGALSVASGLGTSLVLGDLKADSLHLLDSAARIQIKGNVNITNGGSLHLDASNANTNTALVTVEGKMTLGGEFLINLDTNSYYGEKSVKFKLFEAAKYPTAGMDYSFELAMDPIYEEFFQLKDNYKQEMVQSGSLTVTINVKAVVGDLVNTGDVAAMGGDGYLSRGASFYLGSESNEGNPVYFDKKYTIAAGDNAYRLTNGEGWLLFATQMTGDHKLVISKFVKGSNSDSGIVIANNNNSHTGGTSVLNVHLTVDGSVNKGQVMPESGVIGALGTVAVNMLGRESILELRPNGANGGQYRMNNEINLYDGAQLIHSGGSELTLTGAVNSAGTAVGMISNKSEQKLILEGKLTAEQLVLKGMPQISRAGGEGGDIVVAGSASLGSLTLSDGARVDMQSSSQINSLIMDKGTSLNVGGGSELSLGCLTRGSEGNGDALLNLSGGMLTIYSDTQFGGGEQVKLSLSQGAANTLNVMDNASVIVSNLKETDGGLNKQGGGALELAGNMSDYTGNIHVGSGLFKVNTSQLRSDLTVSGNSAQLEVVDNSTLSGRLHISEGGRATLGDTVTLSGDLVIGAGSQLTSGLNNRITGDHLRFESGAKAVFGEETQLGKVDDNTQITMGNNVSLEFGFGSKLNGQLEGGLNFGQGDRFKGELNVGANTVNFRAGSVFEVDGRHYENYMDGSCLMTGTGTINLEKGMKFELSGFNESMSPLPQTMGVINTTAGSLLLDGQEVEHGRIYNEYLSAHPYVWLSFDLLGVNNGLSLYIQKDVRFDLFAQTQNEMAISDAASEIALHAGNYGGELNKLGTVLSTATYDNVQSMLTDLSQSTSSILSGYSVQMQNLRRHMLEIMNRAIQTKPENARLSYEETNNTIWANGISGTYKMDGDANALGNTTSIWGGSLGVSTTVSETTVLGLAFTYTTSDIQVDRGMGKTTMDAYNIDLFARYHKDNWNITGVVTGGFTSHDIQRNLNLDGYQSHTKSSADGNQVMAMVQAGYEFIVSDDQNSILEPFAFVSGGYSSLDGLSETGAGTVGLNVESDSNTLCSLGAGLRFVREYMVEETSFERGRFEARMMVMQDLTDMNPTVSASFQGAPNRCFQQEGVAPGKTALLLGVGVVHPLSQSTAVFADVDGEFRDGGTGVGANVGIKYQF